MRATRRTLLAAAAAVGLVTAACTGPGGPPGASGTAFAAELERFGACDELRDYFVDHALDMVGPYGLEGGHGPHHGPVAEGRGFADDARLSGGDEEAAAAPDAAAEAPQAAPAPQARARGPVAGEDFSATNVQESGVDEPDLAKTDGRRLVTVRDGRLHVLDVSGRAPAEAGSVALPDAGGDELLLAGDRALVLGHGDGHPVALSSSPRHGPPSPTTTLVSVDLAGEPEVAETLTVDGGYVSARLVDGVARVVLRTQPVGLDFTTPEGSGVRAEREATERNREVVERSDVTNWLPSYVREGPDGRVVDEGTLVDCAAVHHPDEFAGLGLAAVFSLDPDAGLAPAGAAGVVGAGETVYATPENLYVAMQRRTDRAAGDAVEPGAGDAVEPGGPRDVAQTSLHRFSIADPDDPAYAASGEVPGRLLDQWALSEHEGHLRVATTEGRGRGPGGPEASESAVRVLDGDLEEVGAVEGLGVGERIYAVRYVGDIGYVVTFREIDPLYTVDLSDPADPTVLGELKITGYSGYLHPLGPDRLLGVGQEADLDGRTLGAQASVFDVADLADPRRVDQLTFPGGHTAVEHDHRALLHWAPEDLLVMPLEQHGRPVPEPPLAQPEPRTDRPAPQPDGPAPQPEGPAPDASLDGEVPEVREQELPSGSVETGPDTPPAEEPIAEPGTRPAVPPEPTPPRHEPFAGAVVLRVEGDRLVEVGRVSHPSGDRVSPPVERALVVGDVLYTVGPEGVLASDLDTLDEVAWVRL